MEISNSINTAKFLYEDETIPTTIDFYVNLQKLLVNLSIGSDSLFEDIFYNHSMLNYYLPYIISIPY